MLSGCVYHMLHALLPPLPYHCHTKVREAGGGSVDEPDGRKEMGQDFLRLEYLCACKIMSSVDIAGRVLPLAPATMLPPLLKAFFTARFNGEPAGSESLSLLPIGEMLLWWPAPSLSLLPLLPLLPPRASAHFSMKGQETRMSDLLVTTLKFLLHIYLTRLQVQEWRERCPVSSLDLSGLLSTKHPGFSNLLAKLQENVTIHYNPNARPDYDRREVVLDVDINEADEVKKLCVLCELGRHHGAGLRVRLGKVRATSIPTSYINTLLHSLHDTGVHSLELEMCAVDQEGVASLSPLSQSLRGLSLAYNRGMTNIEFLTQFPCLTQLNLTGIRLRGSCVLLGNLTQGLEYLNLSGCSLKARDLDALATSRHAVSLRQLDLGENSFGHPLETNALCRLCQRLQNVNVLELEHCGLEKMSQPIVRELVDILAARPLLALVKLLRNDLPTHTILKDLPALAGSLALRCICLTIPSEAYLSDYYTDNEHTINSLRDDFNRNLQTVRDPPPTVDWREESSYSCWYYSGL